MVIVEMPSKWRAQAPFGCRRSFFNPSLQLVAVPPTSFRFRFMHRCSVCFPFPNPRPNPLVPISTDRIVDPCDVQTDTYHAFVVH